VLGAKRRASKDNGLVASAMHPSRAAARQPQDDGEHVATGFYLPPRRRDNALIRIRFSRSGPTALPT